MFDDVLIESAGKDRKKGGWVTALISAVLHIGIIGAVIAAGYYVKQNPEVVQKPIRAFMVSAPPPPPPPPPAPAATHASTPHVHVVVDCGFPLVAAVTPRSIDELGLAAGAEVTAVFKATAAHLLRDSASLDTPADQGL